MAKRNVSQERKATYYAGMAILLLGLVTFGSVFVSAILRFGEFSDFESHVKSMAARAFLGMAMVAVGAALSRIGARGLAGSGVVLDPEKARDDIEPWSRMAGGVIKDAISETGIRLGSQQDQPPSPESFDDRLRKLHTLYQDGILSKEEYEREKAEILDRN